MNNYSKMNPFQAGALAQANFEAAIKSLQPDYNVVSTFASDFAIADVFGADAVIDTYKRSKDSFKDDVFMMTEMTLVLNWAIWRYWELGESELAKAYNDCWSDADKFCMDNFDGDELQFFLKTTD